MMDFIRQLFNPKQKVDLISPLPDDILISIVSRIARTDIKEAVRTSILSKRWRNLYKFVPTIIFYCCDMVGPLGDDPYADHSKAFLDIYRFLLRHSGSIRLFVSSCSLTESHAQIFDECIHILGELGVEKLVLVLSDKVKQSNLSFSCHLLSLMPSLKDFVLEYCILQPNLKRPCNSLKTLRLTDVKVLPGSLECILSNCWSLDTLLIGYCQFSDSKLCFRGPNLQLKCLMIYTCKGVQEIELFASNLITLEFHNPTMINFVLDYAPQLQNFYFKLHSEDVMPYVCGSIGKDFPTLKSLSIEIERDHYQERSIPKVINIFSCLKRLQLELWMKDEINLLSLTPLLHSCPLLQEFHLAASDLSTYNGPQVEKSVVPHSQLKNVDISGFGGTQNEIDFAIYILKSAVGLQQMCISRKARRHEWGVLYAPPWSEETKKKIQEQLQNKAVSNTTQVIIKEFPRKMEKRFTYYGNLAD